MTLPDDRLLIEQQDELKRLEFEILKIDPGTLVTAKGRLFYWDYFFRSVDYTVFAKRVVVLSTQMMERDRRQFEALDEELNPQRWFISGFGRHRLLVVYISDSINTDAQQLCAKKRDHRIFNHSYFLGALDLSNNTKIFAQSTPIIGRVYYTKVNYLLNRLIDPQNVPIERPVSVWLGIVSLILLPLTVLYYLLVLIDLLFMAINLFSWLS